MIKALENRQRNSELGSADALQLVLEQSNDKVKVVFPEDSSPSTG